MADNYLEQRMEDMRSGKLGSSVAAQTARQSSRKGFIQIPFPPRRVVVTGGVNGIGLAIARSFLQLGCKVAVFDIDASAGEEMARKEGVRFYHVDLRDAEALERAFLDVLHAWRDVDIVVNNAGVGAFKPLADSSVEHFDMVMATNIRPVFILANLWAKHKKRYPIPSDYGGRMINITSTRHIQSEEGTEGYSASKGAIASLTHALMMSLSEFGITVNCISPGWIHTGDDSELREEDHLQHPSRRVGKPEDIARACVFLSTPGNDFINGADLVIDGGMTRKMIYIP
ncbi:MAG: SDR family oxidoreductase [Muribaculaceae bacterium]|nr:SDR family oxidoreductase [Muribaculaceae bacterium]